MDSDDNQYDPNDENLEFATDLDSENIMEEESDNENYSFKVLSTNEIVEHMKICINEVNTVLGMPATTTRILLNHYNWDQQKLMEKFYEGDQADQEKLFKDARIVNPFNKDLKQSVHPKKRAPNEKIVCEICFVTSPEVDMTGLDCGHQFCSDCWVQYLTTKIMQEGDVETISCAAHDCPILVDDESILRLIKNSKVREKYQHLITNSFVECNKLLRWCPYPHCNYAIKVQYKEAQSVTCKCGKSFCFECGRTYHEPIKCEMLRKWIRKCNEDLQSFSWIDMNTKDCPACNTSIEKIGGCNHMKCGKKNCGFEFCWVCMESWYLHNSNNYRCNRYVEPTRRNLEKSRAFVKRYLFYSNRFMNHKNSLKFENRLYEAMEKKMEKMQLQGMSWIEVQFLKKAVDTLCLCRQTLMYTYIFPFYLKKSNQLEIFENNQQDLENATEALSEYLESNVTEENIREIKQKVQDKFKYCLSRRKVLVQHVHEGYDNEWWEYLE